MPLLTCALLRGTSLSQLPTTKAEFQRTNSSPCCGSVLVEVSHWPLTKYRGEYRTHILKAIIIHSCWHRSKDKLHLCFSCCVILIFGRTSVVWHFTTSLGATCHCRTGRGIWLLKKHKELYTQRICMVVVGFSPATSQVLLGAHQEQGICRQSCSGDQPSPAMKLKACHKSHDFPLSPAPPIPP